MDISRTLYNRCKKLLLSDTQSLERDHITDEIKALSGIGYMDVIPTKNRTKQKINFQLGAGDAELLCAFIQTEMGLDILKDDYSNGDRVEKSISHNNEKSGSNASQDIVLVNNAAGLLKINQEVVTLFQSIPCAGIELRHTHVESIEHDALIICENFTPMYYLSQLKDNPIFSNALVLYRGDSQTGKRADEVKLFIDYCRASLPVYYYGDFDPSGFNIAKSFNVDGILLPNIKTFSTINELQLKKLAGKNKYFPQLNKGESHVNASRYPQAWHEHIHLMNKHQLGWQQEHLLGFDADPQQEYPLDADVDWSLYKK